MLFSCVAFLMAMCIVEPATALRANAQGGGNGTLEGVVKDASGPLLGATVIVKNTTRGTTTDTLSARNASCCIFFLCGRLCFYALQFDFFLKLA